MLGCLNRCVYSFITTFNGIIGQCRECPRVDISWRYTDIYICYTDIRLLYITWFAIFTELHIHGMYEKCSTGEWIAITLMSVLFCFLPVMRRSHQNLLDLIRLNQSLFITSTFPKRTTSRRLVASITRFLLIFFIIQHYEHTDICKFFSSLQYSTGFSSVCLDFY